MPLKLDGVRTVGCSLDKFIPDRDHLDAIRDAVTRVRRPAE